MERSYCGARAWCWDRDQGTVNFINHERYFMSRDFWRYINCVFADLYFSLPHSPVCVFVLCWYIFYLLFTLSSAAQPPRGIWWRRN